MFSLCVFTTAQKTQSPETTSELTYVQKLGKANVSDYLNKVKKSKKKVDRSDFKRPRNFEGRFPSNLIIDQDQEHGPDKLRQTGFDSQKKKLSVEVLVNRDGQFAGGPPADPTGDAGIEHYLQGVNITDFALYTKDGTLVLSLIHI